MCSPNTKSGQPVSERVPVRCHSRTNTIGWPLVRLLATPDCQGRPGNSGYKLLIIK